MSLPDSQATSLLRAPKRPLRADSHPRRAVGADSGPQDAQVLHDLTNLHHHEWLTDQPVRHPDSALMSVHMQGRHLVGCATIQWWLRVTVRTVQRRPSAARPVIWLVDNLSKPGEDKGACQRTAKAKRRCDWDETSQMCRSSCRRENLRMA